MKGSDKVNMTLNIAGEIIKLHVKFDEQDNVREAEREVRNYIDRMRKSWPEATDRELLALAAYQFAKWYQQLLSIQHEAIEMANNKCVLLDKLEEMPIAESDNGEVIA